jgi:hypothetical protein
MKKARASRKNFVLDLVDSGFGSIARTAIEKRAEVLALIGGRYFVTMADREQAIQELLGALSGARSRRVMGWAQQPKAQIKW